MESIFAYVLTVLGISSDALFLTIYGNTVPEDVPSTIKNPPGLNPRGATFESWQKEFNFAYVLIVLGVSSDALFLRRVGEKCSGRHAKSYEYLYNIKC